MPLANYSWAFSVLIFNQSDTYYRSTRHAGGVLDWKGDKISLILVTFC